MDAYAVWLRMCDWLTAFETEGMMHDDFPDYDWRGCYTWGDTPFEAVTGILS